MTSGISSSVVLSSFLRLSRSLGMARYQKPNSISESGVWRSSESVSDSTVESNDKSRAPWHRRLVNYDLPFTSVRHFSFLYALSSLYPASPPLVIRVHPSHSCMGLDRHGGIRHSPA